MSAHRFAHLFEEPSRDPSDVAFWRMEKEVRDHPTADVPAKNVEDLLDQWEAKRRKEEFAASVRRFRKRVMITLTVCGSILGLASLLPQKEEDGQNATTHASSMADPHGRANERSVALEMKASGYPPLNGSYDYLKGGLEEEPDSTQSSLSTARERDAARRADSLFFNEEVSGFRGAGYLDASQSKFRGSTKALRNGQE